MLVSGQLTENDREKATTSFDAAEPSNCRSQSCYGCSKVFDCETMYRCRSCNGSKTSATDEDNAEPAFCKMCIVGSHLRQDHEIVDHKGYRPAECETHMNLCHYYCDVCAVVFCFDCIDDHRTHRFQPITLKATELRKKVFQYLTENELLAKPIKHQGEVARNCFETKTALLESLAENEISGTLKKVVDEVLCCYSEQWVNLFEQSEDEEADSPANISAIETVVHEAETCHISLRELLQVSDGVFIRIFSAARNKFKVSVKNQMKMLNGHFFLEWTEDLKRHLEIALKEALKSVKIPKLLNFELEQKTLTILPLMKKYKLELDILDWRFRKFLCSEIPSEDCTFWPQRKEILDFNSIQQPLCSILMTTDSVLSILYVNYIGSLVSQVSLTAHYLALYGEDSMVSVCSLHENAIIYEFSLEANCDALDIIPWQNGTFSCLLWNPSTSEVQFSDMNSDLLCLPAKEKPSLVEQFEEFCCLAFNDNSVVVWDTNKDRYFEITKLQHGLSTVDRMKLVNEDTFYIFNYKLLLIVEISFEFSVDSLLNKCSVQRVIKISPFSVNSIKHMTVMDAKLIAYADGKIYKTNLNG